RRADESEHEVMRREVVRAVALAATQNESRNKTGDARIDVNDGTAGEVEHAVFREEAAAPDPVTDRRVNDEAPEHEEDEKARELHALDDRADDERRREGEEGQLEDDE